MLLYIGTTISSNNLRHSHHWWPIVRRTLEYILWHTDTHTHTQTQTHTNTHTHTHTHTHTQKTGYNLQQTSTEVTSTIIELSNQFLSLSLRKLVSITLGDQSMLCEAKITVYLKNYMDSININNNTPLNVRAGGSNNLPLFFNSLKPSGCFTYHKV